MVCTDLYRRAQQRTTKITGACDARGEAERAGTVDPGEEKAQGILQPDGGARKKMETDSPQQYPLTGQEPRKGTNQNTRNSV